MTTNHGVLAAASRPWRRRAARMARFAGFSAALTTLAAPSLIVAGEVDVTDVRIEALGDERFRIDATLRHDDTGWDHFANRWEVRAPDGRVLGTRELLHPHVEEQPFTRSLTLRIPSDVSQVTIVAFDSVHHDGGAEFDAAVPH